MATWPAYAGIHSTSRLVQQRKSALVRSDMEIGPPKQTKVASRVMVTRGIQVILKSLADYNSFITWFRVTINHGADWFDWTDPVDGVTKSARIVNGELTDETPTDTTMGTWLIGLKLETWDNA